MTKIYFSVTNDLTGDQRVHRIITTLSKAGSDICLVGRKLKESIPLEPRDYDTRRLVLIFSKGFLFYACFNVRLFLFLLTRKRIDILVANDLDTLPANFLVSRLRRIPLVYDSHEYFTEVPELIDRESVKRIWLGIEKRILPKLKFAYTVSHPIAKAYTEQYGVNFEVIHNYPKRIARKIDYKIPFNTGGDRLLIYQGAVNVGRGLELIIEVVCEMDHVKLLIAGDGDIRRSLEKKVRERKMEEKIFFLGKIPLEQLQSLTLQAHAGISLEEDLGLNYRFALPNKLFDYIQAGIPVLVSSLPEMKKVVEKYKIGMIAEKRDKAYITQMLQILLFDEKQRTSWKSGMSKAASDLCWENEEEKVIGIYRMAGAGI